MTQLQLDETALALAVHEKNPAELTVTGGEALNEWRERQRVRVPGAEHTPRFKRHQWDGTKAPGRLRRTATGYSLSISRGFLHRLRRDFVLPHVSTGAAADTLVMSTALAALQAHPQLRDYQKEATLRSLAEGWGRAALATNGGKGAVIGLIASVLHQARGHRTLILADEVSVFDALLEEVRAWTGVEPGLVRAGSKSIPTEPVVIAMVQTLGRRLKTEAWTSWLHGFACVLLDEADKASAATWQSILDETFMSTWRVGFSGTFPEDAFGEFIMEETMGPVLVRVKNAELVDRGISARPTVELHAYDCSPALAAQPVYWKDWKEMTGPDRRLSVYDRAIIFNLERHRFLRSLIGKDVPTAVIVNRIDHGQELERVIPGSIFVDGSATEAERDAALTRFKAGSFHVLIVSRIFDRGTNRLGHARDLIFAAAEGSDRQTLQRIGRGLRRTDGKLDLRLVDVVDRGHKYLHTLAEKRVRLYSEEGFDVEVKR